MEAFENIHISSMRVDTSYQRVPNEKRIKGIAKKWDDTYVNPLHVSLRPDGFYYVMDGNHTRLAGQAVGKDVLPCRVYRGLTVKDEAHIFSELNVSQKKPQYGEILKAKALAGCEPEKSYLDLLDKAMIRYSFSRHSEGCRIACHEALLKVYKKTDKDTMLRALNVTRQAADNREEFYKIGIFSGLCDLIITFPEINDDHLIDTVRKTTTSKIRDVADKYRRGFTGAIGGSNTVTVWYRNAFVEIYNKGLRKGRIKT